MRKTFTLSLLFLYFTAFNQQVFSLKDMEAAWEKGKLKRTQKLLNLKDTEISSLPIYDKALLMEEYGRTKDKRIQKKIETVLLPEIFKDDALLFNYEYDFLDKVYNTTDDGNIKAKIQNILHQKQIEEEESRKEADKIVEMFRAEQEEKKQLALEKKKEEELKKILIEGIPVFVIIFLLFTFGMWRLYKNR